MEELDKAFIWNKVLQDTAIENMKNWTAMVFGECGQGKSTTLNEIVEIVAERYYPGTDHACKFKSMESFKSVTSCV